MTNCSFRNPGMVYKDLGKKIYQLDTVFGTQSPNMILLTGPNMGGKSTLLLQVTEKEGILYQMDG